MYECLGYVLTHEWIIHDPVTGKLTTTRMCICPWMRTTTLSSSMVSFSWVEMLLCKAFNSKLLEVRYPLHPWRVHISRNDVPYMHLYTLIRQYTFFFFFFTTYFLKNLNSNFFFGWGGGCLWNHKDGNILYSNRFLINARLASFGNAIIKRCLWWQKKKKLVVLSGEGENTLFWLLSTMLLIMTK